MSKGLMDECEHNECDSVCTLNNRFKIGDKVNVYTTMGKLGPGTVIDVDGHKVEVALTNGHGKEYHYKQCRKVKNKYWYSILDGDKNFSAYLFKSLKEAEHCAQTLRGHPCGPYSVIKLKEVKTK